MSIFFISPFYFGFGRNWPKSGNTVGRGCLRWRGGRTGLPRICRKQSPVGRPRHRLYLGRGCGNTEFLVWMEVPQWAEIQSSEWWILLRHWRLTGKRRPLDIFRQELCWCRSPPRRRGCSPRGSSGCEVPSTSWPALSGCQTVYIPNYLMVKDK